MTQRTESNPPSKIELATQEVVWAISAAVTVAYQRHKVSEQNNTSEKNFRQVIAGYFYNKTIEDWCRDLGIEVSPGDRHTRPDYGGQG